MAAGQGRLALRPMVDGEPMLACCVWQLVGPLARGTDDRTSNMEGSSFLATSIVLGRLLASLRITSRVLQNQR